MKVKDIRQYRSFYKHEIRKIKDPNRNEHFVGVRTEIPGDTEFGFFEIYHGDKEGFNETDGIRGFLEGFLDMAKDGQAVYEFMQNAVDAGSTNFCLFWGKDEEDENTYLLVINNGKMFQMDGVRSILNVGVSTKSSNNFTIGKFGIGFKLAHRLVGRENGLDELIHQNYGPILFSWQDNEIIQLESMIVNPTVEPTTQDYKVVKEGGRRISSVTTREPWLFKILITNFPCQPESASDEIIFDNQYNATTSAFSKSEVQTMARWVRKHREYISHGFEEGSLFFVRLGQGKQSHLEEENLEEGVKFSLAILNKIAKKSLGHEGLHKLNLNGKEINPVELEFEPFIIEKQRDRDDYRYIRFGKTENLSEMELSKEAADSDIEILLGYTDFAKAEAAFHNAPNFYLFFPLSEEKHRLRFILHSNAFYKSASRTFLQKGSLGDDGINERIFKVFVSRLDRHMREYATSADLTRKHKFLDLYANLLLSEPSDNPERTWINEPLYEPLQLIVASMIPVRDRSSNSFNVVERAEKVLIKQTALPVDEYDWVDPQTKWFYWDSSEFELSDAAQNKLHAKRFTIADLLSKKDVAAKINIWLDVNSYFGISTILEELDSINLSEIKDEVFRDNLGKLKIWAFADGYYSLEEIGVESEYPNRLLRFDTLDALKDLLIKAGWKLSIKSLAEFNNIGSYVQLRYQAIVKYIRKTEDLIEVLNLRLPSAGLTPSEKLSVVRVLARKLSDDKDDRISKIRELRLFRNGYGDEVPLKALLKGTQIPWLSTWVIRTDEYDSALDGYLISDSTDIYQNIIAVYWDTIADHLSSPASIRSLLDYARGVYKSQKGLPTLSGKRTIKLKDGFVAPGDRHFYTHTLKTLTESEYQAFEKVADQLGNGQLPDFELLEFYEAPPFKLEEKQLQYLINVAALSISPEAATALLKIGLKQDEELLQKIHLYDQPGEILVLEHRQQGKDLVYSESTKVEAYLGQYHPGEFRLLPSKLRAYTGSVRLQGDSLIKHIVEKCNFQNEGQVGALVELVTEAGINARDFFSNKFPAICLDTNAKLTKEHTSVRLINFLLSLNDRSKAAEIIKSKVEINSGEEKIALLDITLMGQNDVVFEIQDRHFTLSLASILPGLDTRATEIVSIITEKLAGATESDRKPFDQLFGLSGEVDKTNIYHKLKEAFSNEPLKNAHQVAFLLHYTRISKEENLDPFSVYTEANTISFIKEAALYVHESACSYLPPTIRLGKQYDGLKKLIDVEPIHFKAGPKTNIYFEPYFDGNRYVLPAISSLTEEHQRLELIKALYETWKSDREKYRHIELAEKKEWLALIGLEPTHTVVHHEYALLSEKLPKFIESWVSQQEIGAESGERYDFLRALGISTGGSDIVRVRRFFAGKDQTAPIINYRIAEALIINTLTYLEENNISASIFSEQAKLLKQWYDRLPENFDFTTLPLPVISEGEDWEFKVARAKNGCSLGEETFNFLLSLQYPIANLPKTVGQKVVLAGLIGRRFSDITEIPLLQLQSGIIDTEAISTNATELSQSYYTEWKQSYPAYTILRYPGTLPHVLTYQGEIIFRYQMQDIASTEEAIILNGEKNDKYLLGLIEMQGRLPKLAFDRLKTLFDTYDDGVQDFLSRIQKNPTLRREFERLKEKEQIENKKQELSENITQNPPYTMKWFMSLLDLMVMSGSGPATDNMQGDLAFGGIKYDLTDLRILTLTSPSRSISPNIELFTDFFATFDFIDNGAKKSAKVKISGVSKKGSELIVLPTNATELNGIALSQVKQVRLTFSKSLDLIRRLKNAFSQLGYPDLFNFKSDLSTNTHFIFGPPGTGKTTEISNRIINRIQSGRRRILVLTPTNKAADVLANRIRELCLKQAIAFEPWLVRYGTSADLTLVKEELVYDANTLASHLYEQLVLITTVQRFPYEKIITGHGAEGETKTAIADVSWDVVIFDEASMIMLPYVVYPMFKRKYTSEQSGTLTEFIVGGDPLQIPPIYDISDTDLGEDNVDIKEENIYTMVGLQSFDPSLQADIEKFGSKFGNTITNLETQYRSIEPIGSLFSRFQYNNRLGHGRNDNQGGTPQPRQLPAYFTDLGFKPITVIKYPVHNEDAIFTPQKLNDSPFHLYSAFLVNELVCKLRDETKEQWNIGVLSPYRPQANLLNRLLENHKDKTKLTILTDTVHGFQGGECDVVFAVFNPSSLQVSKSRFFNKEFIINVAISRARDYLVLLIPDVEQEMRKLPLFHSSGEKPGIMTLINSLPPDCVAYLNAEDLEKQLMGHAKYFQNRSFTNAHQSVNIYSDQFKEYIIRFDRSSLDVQLMPR
ncbi:MAG: hypothetical protein EOO06_03390 [Chitinophagaceae bacterium]|nr:MAG: hypothetical protein EOO06_03390 [Chitinophagaceae bacterium]